MARTSTAAVSGRLQLTIPVEDFELWSEQAGGMTLTEVICSEIEKGLESLEEVNRSGEKRLVDLRIGTELAERLVTAAKAEGLPVNLVVRQLVGPAMRRRAIAKEIARARAKRGT